MSMFEMQELERKPSEVFVTGVANDQRTDRSIKAVKVDMGFL